MTFINSKFFSQDLLLKITCLAWLLAKIISFKLWITDRFFPVAPVFDFLAMPNEFHLTLYLLSIVSIVAIFFTSDKKIVLLVIILELLSCLLDQMRWQPWEYQYLLTFIIFLYSKDKKQFQSLLFLLIGATYLFSGIHKFDGSFLYSIWDNTILRKVLQLQSSTIKNPIVHYSGILLCIIEVFIGLGYLFFRHKKQVFWLAIIMHLFIILLYGPTGLNHNIIIIPWNFAMIFFALVFFYDKKQTAFSIHFFKSKLNVFVFLLVGILPIMSLFSLWDNYLSFNLYSGNTKKLVICVDSIQNHKDLNNYTSKNKNNNYCADTYLIDVSKWSLNELKVPVYPEERVFKKIKFQFNKKYPDINNTFVYYQYPYKKENIKVIQ